MTSRALTPRPHSIAPAAAQAPLRECAMEVDITDLVNGAARCCAAPAVVRIIFAERGADQVSIHCPSCTRAVMESIPSSDGIQQWIIAAATDKFNRANERAQTSADLLRQWPRAR